MGEDNASLTRRDAPGIQVDHEIAIGQSLSPRALVRTIDIGKQVVMSGRDLKKLRLIEELQKKAKTQAEVAVELDLSVRQVRRLVRQALVRGDHAEAGRLAHSLKSSCANLGLIDLAQICLAIEEVTLFRDQVTEAEVESAKASLAVLELLLPSAITELNSIEATFATHQRAG